MGGQQIGCLVDSTRSVGLVAFSEAPMVIKKQGTTATIEHRSVLQHAHPIVVVPVSEDHPATGTFPGVEPAPQRNAIHRTGEAEPDRRRQFTLDTVYVDVPLLGGNSVTFLQAPVGGIEHQRTKEKCNP